MFRKPTPIRTAGRAEADRDRREIPSQVPTTDDGRRLEEPPLHREYHPDDMRHLHAHAFEEGGAAEHDHHHLDEHRSLYRLTLVMGVLIGGDVVFGWLGWE